jgi:hypothetical protein
MNIGKLTIEITGKPISPCVKVFADGKQIGRLQNLLIKADNDELGVEIEMIQSKEVEKNGKKELIKEPLVLKWKRE